MLISSLPPNPPNTVNTNTLWNQHIGTQYSGGNLKYKDEIMCETLEQHIPLWKSENSPDITHFRDILISPEDDLITMVLYACMDKNTLNIEYLKTIHLSAACSNKAPMEFDTQQISSNKYPKLYELLSKIGLDYRSDCKGIISCLDILKKADILATIRSSIKEKGYDKIYKHTRLNPTNKIAMNIVKYVINNIDFTNLLSDQNNTLTTVKGLQTKLEQNNLVIYLATGGTKRLQWKTNLKVILENLDQLIISKHKRLEFFTAIMLLSHKNKFILQDDIHPVYQSLYPHEYNLTNTLLSLDITDFNTMMSNILQSEHLQNIVPVELPSL